MNTTASEENPNNCQNLSGSDREFTGIKKYAVIVAGGSGQRMGGTIPKQFLELAGKPVLIHTVEVFHSFDALMDIILVLPEEHLGWWQKICQEYHFPIPHRLTTGGQQRFHSVRNGLALTGEEGIVFIHDGVRPLVNHQTLRNCLETAHACGNAIPVVPVTESVRYLEIGFNKTLDRNKVMLVQTPQTFQIPLIKRAYNLPFDPVFTDDASVLEAAGHDIILTEGNRENIKITWPGDLIWAEAILGHG